MVAGLAHESRNALQRGQACLEMLALRLKGQPEALALVAGIQEAQDDLQRIYEEVRNYAAPIRLDRRACPLRDSLGAPGPPPAGAGCPAQRAAGAKPDLRGRPLPPDPGPV
jgi:hypothetical protein